MNKRILSIALAAAMTFTSLPVSVRAEAKNVTSDISYEGYQLKWQDDFNGNSLNREDWNVELHNPGWVNNELQAYVDSDENISVKDGNLYINPVKKTNEDGSVSYTSGRINTQNKRDFTYGLFEVRAKVPKGMGYLPAFWLMATDENVYGQWPRCGEIDCMEVMGQDIQKAYGTIHYGNPHQECQGTYTLTGDDNFSDQFHTFSCEWEPGLIKWYIDGKLYHTANNWYSTAVGQGTLSYPAPFDQPFYIILNLAVGGSWVGNPDDTTSFENNPYVVDYVRVYQKDSYDENVTRPENNVELRDPDANGNYINNGDFSVAEDLTDDTNWKFLTALGGEATASIKNDKMNILTTSDGTVDYSVQLIQADLPFEKGATYQVQFDASASEDRTMFTAVKAPDHGYSEYMPSTKVSLTKDVKTFTYDFKMTSDSDANGRLEFNMGKAGSTADIYIDNVSVKKIKDADPNEKEVKTVLANGNYVYNGEFQEGDKHLGYWDVTKSDNASVSVTGFADGRRLKVDSPDGDALNSVKVSQDDLAFSSGKPYALSFSAEGAKGKEIKVTLGGHEFTATLDGTNQKFNFRIPADAKFTNQNIVFELGGVGTVLLDNVKLAEDALIANGSFNDKFTGYEWYCDSSADASYVVDSLTEDNALDVTINDTSDEDWKIQVKQNNVTLEKGKWYTLNFKAKSDLDRDIRVIMQGGENKGWAVYSGENTVSLTSEFQKFSKTFQMTEDTDPAAFLSICLGKVGDRITKQHRVVIDDISLVEANNPSANLLTNADFSNGMDGWSEYIANSGSDGCTADATSSIEGNKIVYDIKNVGNENYHVQLKHTKLPLREGKTYRISFDALSTVDRSILAGLQSTSYEGYGYTTANLVANKTNHVKFDVTMKKEDLATDFYVSMGKIDDNTKPSKITLSNFSIIEVNNGSDDKPSDPSDPDGPSDEEEEKCNHTYKNVLVPANTKQNGYTAKVCTKCNDMKDKVVINRIGKISVESKKAYNGKTIKPKVTVKDYKNKTISSKYYTVKYSSNKNVGIAKVTITFKGNYQGTHIKSFSIVPATPGKVKVTALKKAFKLSWKKPSQISGFQIQYSSSKAFKKYKTITVSKSSASKIIKGLKSKATVYVRIRAYKSVKNGKKTTKLYSSWSKTLKTKIK